MPYDLCFYVFANVRVLFAGTSAAYVGISGYARYTRILCHHMCICWRVCIAGRSAAYVGIPSTRNVGYLRTCICVHIICMSYTCYFAVRVSHLGQSAAYVGIKGYAPHGYAYSCARANSLDFIGTMGYSLNCLICLGYALFSTFVRVHAGISAAYVGILGYAQMYKLSLIVFCCAYCHCIVCTSICCHGVSHASSIVVRVSLSAAYVGIRGYALKCCLSAN